MTISRYILHFTVFLNITANVKLSVCSGVGLWWFPNSINVRIIIIPIFSVLKNLPNSENTNDSSTFLSMLRIVCIAILIIFGYVFIVIMYHK